jgi:hypothetical protein
MHHFDSSQQVSAPGQDYLRSRYRTACAQRGRQCSSVDQQRSRGNTVMTEPRIASLERALTRFETATDRRFSRLENVIERLATQVTAFVRSQPEFTYPYHRPRSSQPQTRQPLPQAGPSRHHRRVLRPRPDERAQQPLGSRDGSYRCTWCADSRSVPDCSMRRCARISSARSCACSRRANRARSLASCCFHLIC